MAYSQAFPRKPMLKAKVVLMGDSATKKFIYHSLTDDGFNRTPDFQLIGASFFQKTYNIGDQQIRLDIWDTAGQERYHALGPIYYRDTRGAIVVYDITDKDSFHVVRFWVNELCRMLGDNTVLCIVGHRINLEMKRVVSQEEAEEYAASVGAVHYHTSTERNDSIQEILLDLCKRIVHPQDLKQSVKREKSLDVDKSLFEEAMQSGYVLCNLTILLLIGVAGSGKTCFSEIVLGKSPPAVRQSTPLAKAAIRAVSSSRATVSDEGTSWQVVSSAGLRSMLANVIKSKTALHLPVKPMSHNVKAFVKVRTMFRKPKSKVADSSDSGSSAQNLATESKPSLKKLAQSSPVQNVMTHMSQTKAETQEMFSEDWVYLIDSGGQPQFHELIPTFMHHVSGAALFIKLNEDLSNHPVIGYYESGELCGTAYSSSLTHEQTIKNCLQMMQSRLNISGDNDCPTLFFIGTHKDLEPSSCESIDSKDEKILNMLKSGEGLKEHVVFNRIAKPKRLMYVLNTRNPDAQDLETVDKFRQAVMKGCKKIEMKIPLSWFILEQLLQELAKKKSQLVLSFDECLEVARDLEMDKARLLAALDYFVRLNLFKFFPKVLPNIVFTSSQVLLDKISELVAYSHYLSGASGTQPSSFQSGEDSSSLRFGDHAIVNLSFLKQFSAHYRDNLFTPQELLDVLSNQLVFAPFTGEDFFMPCVLPQLSLDKVSSYRLPSSSPVAPILIHYAGGLFSTGLFSGLVAFLQDRSPWKVAERNNEPICLYKNCVMFRHIDFPITLTLIYSYEFIEIHIQVQQGFPDPYINVRTTLFLGLDRAARIQGCTNLNPKVGFFCPCGHNSSHLATVSDDGRWWFCSIDDTRSGQLTVEYTIWLSDYCDHQVSPSAIKKPSKEASTTEPLNESSLHEDNQPRSSTATIHIEDKPTLKQLQVLASRDGKRVRVMDSVAAKWEHLAIALGFEATDMDRIKRNNIQDVDGACREILTRWLNGESECDLPITWSTLIQSLIDAGFVSVAEDIQEVLNLH